MDATTLKMYRDKLRAAEKNIALRLYCDNAIIIDEGFMFVNWDDANNVIMAIKSNEDQVNHPGVKIKTIITGYEMVQYIIAYSTHRSIKKIATDLGYTDKHIQNIIDTFEPQDKRIYLNAIPEKVMEEIKKQQDDIDAQAKDILQKQEARMKEEHCLTATQIRNKQ